MMIIIEYECVLIINENKTNACAFFKQVCFTDKHGDKIRTLTQEVYSIVLTGAKDLHKSPSKHNISLNSDSYGCM